MAVTIVPFYAALLAALFIFLSVRVTRLRRQERVAIGDGNNLRLRRAIRVHANFAEYVPIALILTMLIELQQFSPIVVHALCLTLIVGRLCHAYGVSQERENYRFRTAGMTLTFAAIGASALLLFRLFLLRLL